MTAPRHTWLFRAAAVMFAVFGASWLWRFGFTDYQPQLRPLGLGLGVSSLLLAVFLLRRHRLAIGISALAAAVVGICAAAFAPNAKGPVILFLAVVALSCGAYAVLAIREISRPA